jgi:hypothetical protein
MYCRPVLSHAVSGFGFYTYQSLLFAIIAVMFFCETTKHMSQIRIHVLIKIFNIKYFKKDPISQVHIEL